ncbi:hypothetical protein BJF79_31560 [Actinomadura sp. CNU-125]|uniref:hypothetical protein n=1 Tax=Actinomadura sp. CNU-125 TaxID=1904961 RepID=UPI000961919B|nr:hypothetical protein [Actinomadura sp. CNU-125]OLT36063.1 hypothetical protein BJF79_31560 [Actinomadura sp. CNU-125]
MSADLLILVGIPAGSAAFAGIITYLLTRRDFKGPVAALVTAVAAVLTGASSLFVLYLAPFVFLVTAAIYLVIRTLFRAGPALVMATLALFCGLGLSATMMAVALSSM